MKMAINLISTQPLIFAKFQNSNFLWGEIGGILMKNVLYVNDIPGVLELLDGKKFNVLNGTIFEYFLKPKKNQDFMSR